MGDWPPAGWQPPRDVSSQALGTRRQSNKRSARAFRILWLPERHDVLARDESRSSSNAAFDGGSFVIFLC